MSPLAKIFVVVNLILAVAFFGSSAALFATRINWKTEANRFKADADALLAAAKKNFDEQAKNLVETSKKLALEKAYTNTLVAEKAKVEGNLQEARTELSTSKGRIETEVKEKTQLNSRMQSLEGNNTQLGARVEGLSKEATDAKGMAEKSGAEYTRIRVDLDKSNEQLEKSLIELADLHSKLETASLEIAAAKAAGFTGFSVAPPIDAVVEAVKGDDKLVVLSVGRDQKVQEGFEFTIYRGDRFVGKVKVTKVYENLAGARILFTNEGESIQIGDKAATQI